MTPNLLRAALANTTIQRGDPYTKLARDTDLFVSAAFIATIALVTIFCVGFHWFGSDPSNYILFSSIAGPSALAFLGSAMYDVNKYENQREALQKLRKDPELSKKLENFQFDQQLLGYLKNEYARGTAASNEEERQITPDELVKLYHGHLEI